MKKFNLYLISLFTLLIADSQPPIFLPIDPTEDFYSGSNISLEVQVTDNSSIVDIFLYYRFSKQNSFTAIEMNKDIVYKGEIPAYEVIPGKLEYYFFARDEMGNQSTWPVQGETSPESYPVFEPLEIGNMDGDISIELLSPDIDAVSNEISIIILSIYDPKESLDLNDINLFLDGENVSDNIFKSSDMVTYVPTNLLEPGEHTIELKLIDVAGIYQSKKFSFKLAEVDLSKNEKVSLKEKFKFKGNLSYNSDFDEFFGKDRPENRPFDAHKLNVSAKLSIGNIKVRSSLLLNTHFIDESARLALSKSQPSDRFKLSLSSSLLDFRYGDISTEFSEFSLKGTRVRGTYYRFKLGPFKSSYISGNTKEMIIFTNETKYDSTFGIWNEGETFTDTNGNNQWDEGEAYEEITEYDDLVAIAGNDTITHVNHIKGTSPRKLDAFRTELDFSKFNFGINTLRVFDQIDKYNLVFEELYDKYTFLGNAVVGTDLTIRLNNKKTQFKAEMAISLMNDLRGTPLDTLAEKLDMDPDELESNKEIFNSLEEIVGFSVNSDLIIGASEGRGISIPLPNMDSLAVNGYQDYLINSVLKQGTYRFLFKTPLEFYNTSFDFQAEYKRVPPNFVSLGNSSIQTDIQGLKSSMKARLFKNILSLSLGYDNENDNLMGETPEEKLKSSTSTSIVKSGGLGLSYSDLPSVNYSVRIMDRDGISVQNSELVTSNQTITHTITPSYKFDTRNKLNISIGGNIMMMSFIDNLFNSLDETATNTNFNTGSYTGTLGLRFDSPLTINMGGGISINSPEDINSTDTKFTVFTSKVGYKFLEKTMSTFLGVNIVSGNKGADIDGNGGIDNLKMTLKAGFQYKFSSNMSLGLNMDFISLTDNLVPDNDFTELKAKIKFKMGF